MSDVLLLALAPRRLWDGHRIRAALDDIGDGIAKPMPNIGNPAISTRVFSGIMQQRADGFILRCAIFESDAGHP
jgi:hypothetical protein